MKLSRRAVALLPTLATLLLACPRPYSGTICSGGDCPEGFHCDEKMNLCIPDDRDGGLSQVDASQDASLADGGSPDRFATTDSAASDRSGHESGRPDAAIDDAAIDDAAIDDAAVDDAALPCPGPEPPPSSGLCNSSDLTLGGCYTFDADQDQGGTYLVQDSSSYAAHGSGTGFSYVSGVSGQALSAQGTGEVVVPDSDSLDATDALTIDAWVWARALPGGRMGIVDNNGQYGFFVYSDGRPRCIAVGDVYGVAIPLQTWTHLVCVYDLPDGTLRIYQDGALTAEGAVTNPLNDGTDYVSIGGNSPAHNDLWDGMLDSVRIWTRSFDAREACWAAQ